MGPTYSPRVKICCISTVEEAALAIECGASALGLVSAMPSEKLSRKRESDYVLLRIKASL